jgi:hypothetical protein
LRKLLALSVLVLSLAATSTAQASLNRAPWYFRQQAVCVHSHEAGAWRWTPTYHPGYSYWNKYWTGMQFMLGTWRTANHLLHRRDSPYTGNPRIIILHAYAIVRKDGGSWREWRNTANMCGLPTY